MHVDILNSEFLAFFEVSVSPGIAQFPTLRFSVPFGGIELYPFPTIGFDVFFELGEAVFTIARIPAAVCDDTVRMLFPECLISV
jgi:hypothetical protein